MTAPSEDPRVRPARPGDRDAVLAVQSTLSRPNPALLRAGLDAGVGRVLVSTADDRPVGYLLALDRPAGPPADTDTDARPAVPGAYVAELAVAPPRRREGRATGLLRTLLAVVDGRVTLTVAPDNDPAVACYRSLDFAVLRRAPTFFDGDPALVMGRS